MQRKIIIAIILNVVVISVTLSVTSYITIHESIERSLQNRLAISRIIANNVEVFLNNNLNRLNDISRTDKVNPSVPDRDLERRVLETVYRYSLFTEGVFILDRHGNKLVTYPDGIDYLSNLAHIPYFNQVLQHGKPVISNVYTIEPIKKKVIFIMTALKNREGGVIGVAGGMLSPREDVLHNVLRSAKLEERSYVEIIDSNEVVVASDKSEHALDHHDHGSELSQRIAAGVPGIVECKHGFSSPDAAERPTDLLAFVPLRVAPWAIVVGQSENDIFAPTRALQRDFILLVIVFTTAATVLSVVIGRKIVRPLRTLTSSVNRLASGDLTTPVGNLGQDEILQLSRSFDDMREKLAESLERITTQNLELENRVAKRTAQIRASRQHIEDLLKKIITSQEDERKRIARDVHDTILQDISAFLIQLDICRMHPQIITVERIDEMREIAVKIIDNIHALIKDLRPSVLDDLGINAAIRWLLERHLVAKGIECSFNVESPITRRLPPTVETTVFRILQEAIVNIARHSNARKVTVTVAEERPSLRITVVDDGGGFDFSELIRAPSDNGRGLGLLGMKERASLINGRLAVISLPGVGTEVNLTVPMEEQVEHA